MRFFYFAGGGALAASMLGWNIYLGMVIGLALAIVLLPSPGRHRVIVENVETGEVKIQPNDFHTKRYLSTRKED